MDQSVGLTIDPARGAPIYRQIFDEIAARIQSRAFPPGYKLPPSRVLAIALATHRNTVARAYTDLEAAGFVSSTVGRGTFVTAEKAKFARAAHPTERDPREHDAHAAQGLPWASLLARGARADVIERAERYARQGDRRDVVNLARMQPSLDLIPDDLMRRCIEHTLREQKGKAMTYAPPEGLLRLREQIANDLATRGLPANADDILVTSGSQQALDLIARTLINPGDALLVDSTTYSGAIDLFSLAGARLVAVQSDEHGPDLGALARGSHSGAKALYLMPNGHNPTSRTIPIERRRELLAWSQASCVPLIEDDYGAGLFLDSRNPPPYLRALSGDVIHVSTFSKRLIPALRVGFIVTPPALRPVLRSMKRIMDLGASAVVQHALAEFIERGYMRAHMNRIIPEYRARRDALDAALRKALPPEIRWERPTHGIVMWLKLPESIDPDALYEEALRHGVLVSPSPMWSVERDAERGVRLAFCAETPARLTEGAKRLGKAVKALTTKGGRKTRRESAVMEIV